MLKKIKSIFAAYIQVLVVWLGFALMVLSSYHFMSGIEARHLRSHVEDLLTILQSRLEAEMLETKVTLNNVSFTIRRMILDGGNSETVLEYLTEISDYVSFNENHLMETNGTYGYFDVFNGAFLDGSHRTQPDDYDPLKRPWYEAAVAANGSITNTSLYIDTNTGNPVTSFVQQIFDDDGRPLYIICMDISLTGITQYIISAGSDEGGYGILLNENLNLVVHPSADQLGRRLSELSVGQDIIMDLEMGLSAISEREIINYKNEPVIMFSKRLNNNWYLGIMIPKEIYYKSLRTIAAILALLGTVLAGILSFILYRIIKQKQKADERVQVMMKETESTAHWYKSILDAIPLPITVTDANTNWTFVNTQVENFLKVKFEDIKGKPCSNWNAHICKTPNCGIECAKRGIKHTYFNQNGSSYKVDVEILKDIKGETAGYIEVVQDITQLEEISKRQTEAETVSKAKSAFIATMSHEIRTPLNAILGIADIEIQNRTIPQDVKEALIKIHNSGDLLLHIINDILDLSKIETGKLELTLTNYDVPSLINDTVHLNMARINSKQFDFELELCENIPRKLFGDELRIKQILNNILSNAFKYTEHGKVMLSVDVENANDETGVMLVFNISDTGQGMTQEQIANMFNEYSNFNMETTRSTDGTGLGMSITKHLVRLMDGEINVKSEPGAGSTFTVRLWQKRVNSEMIGKELAENLRHLNLDDSPLLKKSQIVRDPMPYGKVLIVDDVETNLYVARGLLVLYDIKIDLASSGFEALEKVKNGKVYDIIFMDHMMPKMDGIETTKLIRETGYTKPIVALTANAVVGQAEMFLQSGFDDFISKPIDIRRLNAVLNKLLRDKQPPEVIEKARLEKADRDKNIVERKSVDTELAEIFTRDAAKSAAVMESVLKNKFESTDDIQSYIINVHAMKSALANVGETGLSATALRLEQAGRNNDVSIMFAETRAFLRELNKVVEKIKPKETVPEANEDSEESLAFMREKLTGIENACAAFDKKTIKNALAELNKKTWSHDTKELLNKIAEHLLHSEFDEIEELVKNFLRKEGNELRHLRQTV